MVLCKLDKKTLLNYNTLKPYLDGDMLITPYFLQQYTTTLIDVAKKVQTVVNCMSRQETNINKQYKDELDEYYDILQKIKKLLNYNARNLQAKKDFEFINSPNYTEGIIFVIFSMIFLLTTIILILKK